MRIETTIQYGHKGHVTMSMVSILKFLNYVCVFYMRIETTIQYGHKGLKLEQFNKKLKQQFNI
jgi:hypothetical protein